MRRFSTLFALAFVLSLSAFAASFLGSTTSTAITAPTSSSDGWTIVNPAGVQSFTYTLSDQRDGSVGDGLDQVLNADIFAWCYAPISTGVAASGAPTQNFAWSRMPTLDAYIRTVDAGTGIGGNGAISGQSATVMVSTVSGYVGVPCTRIAATVTNVNAGWDSGVMVYRLTGFETD